MTEKNNALIYVSTDTSDVILSAYKIGKRRRAHNTFKVIDTTNAILGFSGICVQYSITEIIYESPTGFEISYETDVLCYANMITTILLCFTLLVRYCIVYQTQQHQGVLKDYQELEDQNGRFSKLLNLVSELLVCSVFLPPHVSMTFSGTMLGGSYTYHIGEAILIIMLLRIYLLVRLYEHYSQWTSAKAQFICEKYSTEASFVFGLKSDLKMRPFATVPLFMGLLILVFGIAVMESEKDFTRNSTYTNLHMERLGNDLWLVIITMLTVGYGDVYPCTHQGRFFCILACISGMILISALIVAQNETVRFTKDQKDAYLAIKNRESSRICFSSASNVIKNTLRLYKYKGNTIKRYKQTLNLKITANHFIRISGLSSFISVNPSEMLDELKKDIEKKLSDTKKIISTIPDLTHRVSSLKYNQIELEKKVSGIIRQQEIISKYFLIGKSFAYFQ